MCEVKKDHVGFKMFQTSFNNRLSEVHCGHEKGVLWVIGEVWSSLGAEREAVDVRNGDRNKEDEMWVEIEMAQSGDGVFGHEEWNLVATFGKFVGDVKEWCKMA